jgi:two-component system cell cycle sensor histidine kinase/response regulator CckA
MNARAPQRDRRSDLRPARIALAYCLISLAWIFGSGYVVSALTSGATSSLVEVGKGTGFVVVTAVALYILLARRARSIRVAEAARAAADEERLRLATAVEQAAEAIVITDPDSRILYANPALERMSGFSRSELVGRHASLLGGSPSAIGGPSEPPAWPPLSDSESWHGIMLNVRKDGGEYEVDTSISPIRADGRLVCYVAVERDVSRERALERGLAEAGRMEAVGQLAGGIAHDFNNMLTAISGYAELLGTEVVGNAAAEADVDEILRASRSAATLVRQLLAMARRQILDPKGLALDELVEQLRPMLDGLLGPRITIAVECEGRIRPVFADAGQIEQVLVNLTLNARDAMPSGGAYTLSISNAEIADDDARASLMKPGRYVLLAASDTGVGMDEATRSRIFDPFFTTKPAGQGTGLGLATTYGIVTQSGGYLLADSEPGRGSTFSVYLPQHSGPVAPRPREAIPEPLPRGSETVLVVEDDPAVRELVTHALKRLGYRVLVSADATAAMASAAAESAESGPPPLLVTDIRLPGLDGPSLAARLRERHPGLRVLYVSGYAGDAMVKSGLVGPDEAFLAKPFTAEDLARRVRSLLDA